MSHPPTHIEYITGLLEAAQDQVAEALNAIEEATASAAIARYIPPNAVADLSETLDAITTLANDPPLLLGDVERETLSAAIERVSLVLADMDWERPSGRALGYRLSRHEIGVHFGYVDAAVTALESIASAADTLRHESSLLSDEGASATSSTVAVLRTAAEALLGMIGADVDTWLKLRPRDFEEILAEIWAGLGWQTVLTPPTRDGGFDIRAVRDERGSSLCYLVEAKAYRPDRAVGIAAVRHLYGVVERERASHGVIATTSTFTRGAQAEAATLKYRVSLADFERIQEWVAEYRRLKTPGASV